jgi:hypothetical protein
MIKNTVGIVMMAILICSTSLAITIDGDFGDWTGVTTKVDDDQDMADSSGDVKMIQAAYEDGQLYLRMAVYGIIAPAVDETPAGMTNRYYYHWILDTDDNVDTGFNNSEYEGNATNVTPIGVDVVVMIGWRDGNPNGVEVYDALTEDLLMENFDFKASGDSIEAMVPLEAIGVNEGDTVSFSAFQEGASDDWAVDWLEPTTLVFVPMAVQPEDKLAATWANLKVR